MAQQPNEPLYRAMVVAMMNRKRPEDEWPRTMGGYRRMAYGERIIPWQDYPGGFWAWFRDMMAQRTMYPTPKP